VGATQEGYSGEADVRLPLLLTGLTVTTVGLSGVFSNTVYGEGLTATLGIGISLVTLTLGLIITYMGLRAKWSS
jgi:hypothetical protein